VNNHPVDVLGIQEIIRSERTREKSRSCVNQGGRVDRQCASRLNSVCQLEAERRPQSCSAFRNIDVKRDRLPRFEDRAVTSRERVICRLQRPGQHLGDGESRYSEA